MSEACRRTKAKPTTVVADLGFADEIQGTRQALGSAGIPFRIKERFTREFGGRVETKVLVPRVCASEARQIIGQRYPGRVVF